MLEAVVHTNTIQVNVQGQELTVNGQSHVLDIISLQNGKYFHLIYKQHSYIIEVISFDKNNKIFTLAFDGRTYTVGIKDRFDQLLHSMGLDIVSKPIVNEVKAPMPGLVLNVQVKAGQEIKKGDALLILEAMKMENIIKSPIDGVVKEIMVKEKQAVDKNQTLIQFN